MLVNSQDNERFIKEANLLISTCSRYLQCAYLFTSRKYRKKVCLESGLDYVKLHELCHHSSANIGPIPAQEVIFSCNR